MPATFSTVSAIRYPLAIMEEALDSVRTLFGGLDDHAIHRPEADGKWSMIEAAHHLGQRHGCRRTWQSTPHRTRGAETTDLNALWRQLGVVRRNGSVVFDDDAPRAGIRRALTNCLSCRKSGREPRPKV